MNQNDEEQAQPVTMESATRVMSLQAEAHAALALFHEGAASMSGANMRKLQSALETMGGQLQKQAPILTSAKAVCEILGEVLPYMAADLSDNEVGSEQYALLQRRLREEYDNYEHQVALQTDGDKGRRSAAPTTGQVD